MKKTDKIENAYIAVLAVIIAIIIAILGLNAYSNFKNVESEINVEEIAKHEANEIESASLSIGNSVVQSQNILEIDDNNTVNNVQTSVENNQNIEGNENIETQEDMSNSIESTNSSDVKEENLNNQENQVLNEAELKNTSSNLENEGSINIDNQEVKSVTFVKPIDGEIVKEFAKDNLVYSETLDEWTTHLGIDIKAEKTAVVKCAEQGIVKSIKNDPRFGLTIIVEHEDGFQTRYSNLLSSEFVVEGENVIQGQSLGTVGNSSTFEFLDASHLHFELLQNGEYLDPIIFIK